MRKHATTKAVEKMANEHPDLYAVAKQAGDLPDQAREELQKLMRDLFEERMKKHHIAY